ncbi:MAG: L-threonylcarbamoyladenylate synthase [Candidatus Campbellbacteria bacterium]|nr:L-threonylcarbamoyladenylate synthase [Candidatus Campbellbacteria bacterium]
MVKKIEENAAGIIQARAILEDGGVLVFPTDTAYGLAVRTDRDGAITKISLVKGRPESKAISVVVSDIAMAKRYGVFSPRALAVAEAFLPGPLTLVVPARERVSKKLLAEGTTIGFRIPNRQWVLDLVRACNFPITATSANASDTPACYSIPDVKKSLKDTWKMIDGTIDGGQLPETHVSTVVQCVDDMCEVLREGPISREDIDKVIG